MGSTIVVSKVIFLAPTKTLAEQQANVLLDQIGFLKSVDEDGLEDNDHRWRLRLIVGSEIGQGDGARSVQRCQIAVMTPQKFEDARALADCLDPSACCYCCLACSHACNIRSPPTKNFCATH